MTDEYGREPLLATKQGRPVRTTLPKYAHRYSRPCTYGKECPHGRNPDSCEAAETGEASKCPSSISLYAIQRGSITHHLLKDIPEITVSDWANVSQQVLEQHHDRRSQRDFKQGRGKYSLSFVGKYLVQTFKDGAFGKVDGPEGEDEMHHWTGSKTDF